MGGLTGSVRTVILSYDTMKGVRYAIQLNFNSGKPAYLQVVDQVKTAAASGSLQAGEALPTIRILAEQLRINRNTVAKAYTELESQGVIVTSAGKGCFLANNHSPLTREARWGELRRKSTQFLFKRIICKWIRRSL